MKTTIDVPDDLYRRLKAKAALEGRHVRDVTIELYRRWLGEEPSATGSSSGDWLASWTRMADETARPGPTAREILEQERNRLEQP